MKNGVLGLGVIGCGAIAIRSVFEHFSIGDLENVVQVAAVCDPVPGRAKGTAEKYGYPAYYESFDDLLLDPNIDILTICSPINFHFEQGMKAIAAGKHIHFNKTMALTVEECDQLIAAAKAKGVKIIASPNKIMFPHLQRIRRLVLEGKLGTLGYTFSSHAHFSPKGWHFTEKTRQSGGVLGNISPAWYFKKPAGGPMYDVTIYALHALTDILGPAKRVTAMSGQRFPYHDFNGEHIVNEIDDSVMLLIDYGGGLISIAVSAVADAPEINFDPCFYGTEGCVIQNKWNGKSLIYDADRLPFVPVSHDHLSELHVFSDLMQLVEWVRNDIPSIATAERARHGIEIIEAAYKAAATGITQDLKTTFEPMPLDMLAEI